MEEEANQQGRAANPESEDCSRLYLTSTFVKQEKKKQSSGEMEKEKCSKKCVTE